MTAREIIEKKRDGLELSDAELRFFTDGCVSGAIPDYQASAFLMAVYFSGMTDSETAAFTYAMRDSGDILDLSAIDGITADKHSTGGVGDKTTLIIAPILAACGIKMLKMSGRGLGNTGGTIDKLESIPGFSSDLSEDQIVSFINDCGMAVCSQTEHLAPADKILYALRNAVGAVESIPLIASSVMSKKLAVHADALVLDVKYGSGAFMKTREDAYRLAELMKKIGLGAGVKTDYILSDMNQPLGRAVGNSLEVIEAIEMLKVNSVPTDLRDNVYDICKKLLICTDTVSDEQSAEEMITHALLSGSALDIFRRFIINQGGDASVIKDYSLLPSCRNCLDIRSPISGIVHSVDCGKIGEISCLLGAGRQTKDAAIDYGAGIIIMKKVGEAATENEIIAKAYFNSGNPELIYSRICACFDIYPA